MSDYDDPNVIQNLTAAADRGDVDAQVRLAFELTKGNLVERTLEKAAQYYQLAADQGSAIAQHNLATMYLNGQGVECNQERAIYWFEKAAAQNDVDAQFNLALIFDEHDALDDALDGTNAQPSAARLVRNTIWL